MGTAKAQCKDNHYVAKEKRSLGVFSRTGQVRTPWTSRVGHRCILRRDAADRVLLECVDADAHPSVLRDGEQLVGLDDLDGQT